MLDITAETKKAMKQVLKDIQDGTVRSLRMQAISMLHIVRSIQLRRDAHIQLLMELNFR